MNNMKNKKDNVVYNKAYQFAIRVIKTCQFLTTEKKEYVLSKQLLRCGTSIGANIAEADGAISKADFSNKISISYKESLETKYWLSLLKDTFSINEKQFDNLFTEADELSKILFSILKTTRIKKEN